MELHIFEFIKTVSEYMEKNSERFEEASDYIEKFFDDNLRNSEEGYLNINSRVKSIPSLKEKILRNSYYKFYDGAEEFLDNLHDLIGVRIECRFIEDEKVIYNSLKKLFNIHKGKGYYSSELDENLILELESTQPQVQKNGFEIYRIDGMYIKDGQKINFELQIKSLVNVFWGEIEHKIIYKNNNYTMGDDYVKQMLASIKENLAMIDNQLLIIDNQYNRFNAIDPHIRRSQLEKLLAKITYEIFATKMKESIGFNVDFKKSCDAIVDYMVRTTSLLGNDPSEMMIRILTRLNEIEKLDVDFSKEISFEREVTFEDKFSNIISEKIKSLINTDFHWYLFFRILFEIERGNNAEDFEGFIIFIQNRFLGNEAFSKLYYNVDKSLGNEIKNKILIIIAEVFNKIGNISFIHEDIIEEINSHVSNVIELICNGSTNNSINSEELDIYLSIFNYNIQSALGAKIEVSYIVDIVKKIKNTIPNNLRRNYSLEYINELLGIKKN
ncbi:MAG: hypothetical protein MR639_13330 [Clostridium sp.]|uniref:GTP pyrophosphokinase n=1 Tax=Clostridium sp. TaxID=1506 RepID=UPI002A86E531|nr:hypothetical protein [Clostridium sp.]MDY5096939.1 hypothetical protein [Clostridium sp.]